MSQTFTDYLKETKRKPRVEETYDGDDYICHMVICGLMKTKL